MKLNYKNISLSIGISILLCSALPAESPILKTCPNFKKAVHSVINVKEPIRKALSHAGRIASSIVSIESNRDGDVTQTSGFLITENGYILTSYLHIKDADNITVTLLNGKELPAILVQKGTGDLDAAIIKIDGNKLPYLALDTPNKSLPGWIFSIGSPTSGNHLITISTVKEKTTSKNVSVSHLETDALHSGSPLFDLEGNLIGMHLGSYPIGKERLCSEPLDKGFAIPLSILQQKKSQLEGSTETVPLDNPNFLIYSRHYKCVWK